MEDQVKLFSSFSLLVLSLFCVAGGANASEAVAEASSATAAMTVAQDNQQTSNAAPSISGSWQLSWTARKGGQRQVTMQVKQDGSKLSGSIEGERGSTPLKGSLQGNRVSFSLKMRKRQVSFSGTVNGDKMSGTTEEGASWTATRQR
jgi:hypothetical protein